MESLVDGVRGGGGGARRSGGQPARHRARRGVVLQPKLVAVRARPALLEGAVDGLRSDACAGVLLGALVGGVDGGITGDVGLPLKG